MFVKAQGSPLHELEAMTFRKSIEKEFGVDVAKIVELAYGKVPDERKQDE
jgi:hypothetical protein